MPDKHARISVDHPAFPQPRNPEVPVWRYMNLPKLLSSLTQHGLFFSRVDCLGDAWEGVPSAATSEILRAVEDAIVDHGDESLREEIRGTWRSNYDHARTRAYASCWQAAPRDVWWMWKVYCESDFGVAIRSTYAALDRELPRECFGDRHIMLGHVKYGDYDSDDYTINVGDIYSPVMSKRDAFGDEREVRALCDAGASTERGIGFFVPVDLERLLDAVIVSPFAQPWFRGTVEATIRAMGYRIPVEDSRLRRMPALPF